MDGMGPIDSNMAHAHPLRQGPADPSIPRESTAAAGCIKI